MKSAVFCHAKLVNLSTPMIILSTYRKYFDQIHLREEVALNGLEGGVRQSTESFLQVFCSRSIFHH